MFKSTKAFSSFSANDLEAAKRFYGEVLGLELSEANGLLTLHISEGGNIMVYPKDNHAPASFTVLNFPVENIESAVDELTSRGVRFETYEGFQQDEKGIARDPQGPAIAWFTDPAGNILAVLEGSMG